MLVGVCGERLFFETDFSAYISGVFIETYRSVKVDVNLIVSKQYKMDYFKNFRNIYSLFF